MADLDRMDSRRITPNNKQAVAARQASRRSTYVKTKKRVTRTRSDRQSGILTKQSTKIVVRIRDAKSNEPVYYKPEGDRYKSDKSLFGIKGTVKLLSGRSYNIQLSLPQAHQIRPKPGSGELVIQAVKNGEEEAQSIQVQVSGQQQTFEWTNTFELCKNKTRQVLKLSFITEQTERKLTIPIMLKTYEEGNVKGAKAGKELSFMTYKLEPTTMLEYDVLDVEFH